MIGEVLIKTPASPAAPAGRRVFGAREQNFGVSRVVHAITVSSDEAKVSSRELNEKISLQVDVDVCVGGCVEHD